jgi:hypothetical protein
MPDCGSMAFVEARFHASIARVTHTGMDCFRLRLSFYYLVRV